MQKESNQNIATANLILGLNQSNLPLHLQIYHDTEPGQTAGNRTHDTA